MGVDISRTFLQASVIPLRVNLAFRTISKPNKLVAFQVHFNCLNLFTCRPCAIISALLFTCGSGFSMLHKAAQMQL